MARLLLLSALAAVAVCSAAMIPYPAHLFHKTDKLSLLPNVTSNAHYITHKEMVEMRDGTKLHTIVFVPSDLETSPVNAKTRAAVLMRTPYGSDGLKGEGEFWVNQGFVAVMQDFRGRYKSKGDFSCWFDATSDGGDTVRWIKKQSWSNKRVFAQGVSANGIAAYLEEADETLAGTLLAQYLVVGTAELYLTIYQGGAYRYSLIHGWLDGIKELSFEPNFIDHEAFSTFWEPVTMTDKWKDVTAPGVHMTGWYDIFNQEQLRAYNAYQTESTLGRGLNFLMVLPTGHCQGGQVDWPKADDGIAVGQALAVTMFKALAVAAEADDTDSVDAIYTRVAQAFKSSGVPEVQYYVMGPNGAGSAPSGSAPGPFGNYWASGSALPAGQDTFFYLNASKGVSPSVTGQTSSISYIYDPKDPVPTRGGNNLLLPQCGPWDQSELEKRADVVSFTSDPLGQMVFVSGNMRAQLFVSTNCSDTDFTVKVLDVYPNGTSMMVQDGIVRMRWANDTRSPHLLTPNQVYMAEVDVWSTAYIFNAGHRIRVDISSSNFPRFSANANTGDPLEKNSTDTNIANNTIWVGPSYPSKLILPVVPNESIPEETSFEHLRKQIANVFSTLSVV